MAVTTQSRPASSLEVSVTEWQAAGLLRPSVIKPVLATIERALVGTKLGKLQPTDLNALLFAPEREQFAGPGVDNRDLRAQNGHMCPIGSKRSAAREIGAFVRERRRANGLSQTELALLAGVGRRFISELESGKDTVRLDKVEAVLAVFGRDLEITDGRTV